MPRYNPKPWACVLCEATLAGQLVRRSKLDKRICDYCEAELARYGRKRCRKCSVVQALTAFPCDKHNVDRHTTRCSACRVQESRVWRRAHPQYERVHRQTHTAQKREKERRYRQRHPWIERKLRRWQRSQQQKGSSMPSSFLPDQLKPVPASPPIRAGSTVRCPSGLAQGKPVPTLDAEVAGTVMEPVSGGYIVAWPRIGQRTHHADELEHVD